MSLISSVNSNSIHVYSADSEVRNERKIPFQNAIRFAKDTLKGLASSRIVCALAGAGAVTGIGFQAYLVTSLALVYLGLTPPGWMSAALIVGITVVMGIAVIVASLEFLTAGSGSWNRKDVLQELECEWTHFVRLWKFEYNEITWEGKKAIGKIFLGPMPNRLHRTQGPKQIAQKENLAAVLSVNAPGPISDKGERGLYGLMHPATAKDWHDCNVKKYAEIDIADHHALELDQLDAAADFIHSIVMRAGTHNNIYVHCKAGKGRSAMAVAAYIIKYGKLNPDQALDIIRSCRPGVTLGKPQKMAQLRKYHRALARL